MDKPDREALIRQAADEGWKLQALGDALGVSGERARQLLVTRGRRPGTLPIRDRRIAPLSSEELAQWAIWHAEYRARPHNERKQRYYQAHRDEIRVLSRNRMRAKRHPEAVAP